MAQTPANSLRDEIKRRPLVAVYTVVVCVILLYGFTRSETTTVYFTKLSSKNNTVLDTTYTVAPSSSFQGQVSMVPVYGSKVVPEITATLTDGTTLKINGDEVDAMEYGANENKIVRKLYAFGSHYKIYIKS